MDVASLEISTRNGAHLNWNLDAAVPSVLLSQGTLGGTGTLTVTETMNWTGGEMGGGGTTAIAPGATLTIDASSVGMAAGGRTIANQGTIDWLRGNVNASGSARLSVNNQPGGLFDIRTNASLGATGSVFNNAGLVRKSAGTGRSAVTMALNNTGTAEVQAGTLAFTRGGNSSGDFSFDAGTTLELHGGVHGTTNTSHTITLGPTNSLAGQGRLLIVSDPVVIQGSGLLEAGTLEVSSSAFSDLRLNLDATIPNVILASGVLGGTGTLTVTESMTWTGGDMANDGTTRIAPGATLTLDAPSNVAMGHNSGTRTIDNHGTFRWLRGSISGSTTGRLNFFNRPGALIDIQSNATVGAYFSVLNNEGTVRKSAGTGVSNLILDLSNSGNVEVLAGTLNLDGGGTSSGNFQVAAGATLQLDHGDAPPFSGLPNIPHDITLGPAGSLVGQGRLLVTGQETTIGGSGHLEVQTLEVSSSAFVDLHLNLDATIPNTIHASGTLAGTGTLTVTESMNWTGGETGGGGKTVIANDATLTIDSSSNVGSFFTGTRTIDNFGAIRWLRGNISLSDPLTFHNRAGALFEIRTDATLNHQGALINDGTLRKTAGTGTTVVDLPVSNSGAIEVHGGTLRFARPVANWSSAESALIGGTWLVSTADPLVSSATLRLDGVSPFQNNRANITLDGPGTSLINQASANLLGALMRIEPDGSLALHNGRDLALPAATFDNKGALTLGVNSTLTLAGDYTQSADGRLVVALGGDAASGDFGQLTATGAATLDGELELQFANGFGPVMGQSWQPLSFAARTGTFQTTVVPFLARQPSLEVVHNADHVAINALITAGDLNLVPGSILAPDEAVAGQDATIQYTVENLTDTPFDGEWIDSLYLSANSTLDPTDRLIARHEHTGGVAGLESYSETVNVPLPADSEGLYRVIVVADSRGLVPDIDRTNNGNVSVGAVRISVTPLPIGGSIQTPIADGQELFFRIDVPPGADVRLAANLAAPLQAELLSRFGTLPTRSEFDLSATDAASLAQQILLSGRSGAWYLLVRGREGAPGMLPLELSAQLAAFELTGIFPATLSNVGESTLTLNGSGFTPGTVVKLIRPDGTELAAIQTVLRSRNEMLVTFDLEGLEAGDYEVVIDNGVDQLRRPQLVSAGGAAGSLDLDIWSPDRIRIRGNGTIHISVHNPGNSNVSLFPFTVEDTESGSAALFLQPPRNLGDA